jgi:hypothetical protein
LADLGRAAKVCQSLPKSANISGEFEEKLDCIRVDTFESIFKLYLSFYEKAK